MEQFAIPSIVPNAAFTQGGDYSAQGWEDQRERITRLYSVENRSLDEVIVVMRDNYGFKATYVHFHLVRVLVADNVEF